MEGSHQAGPAASGSEAYTELMQGALVAHVPVLGR